MWSLMLQVEPVSILSYDSTNDSNILTKNVSAELNEKHSKKLVIEKPWRYS